MTKTGALYWLLFLISVGLFILLRGGLSNTPYLILGLLLVMAGLLKFDHDRHCRSCPAPVSQPEVNRLREVEAAQAGQPAGPANEQMEQMAKKMIELENRLSELSAALTGKYAVRSGRGKKA